MIARERGKTRHEASGGSRRRSSAGYAMVSVLVITTISMFAITAAYDRIHQVYRFEEAADRIPSGEDGIAEALGSGLARLQTGEPSVDAQDEYVCDLTLRTTDGSDTEKFRLTYTKLANNEWTLLAEPAGAAEPPCPPVFTDETCPIP